MRKISLNTLFLFCLLVVVNCSEKPDTLFVLRDADETGVVFNNHIEESDTFNILTYEYIYNGGGIGIADFNNDGLQDIFFTGNQVPNALYLNQGNFQFKDITKSANVNVENRWNEGVAIVDINNDGWMDIYVCATTYADAENRRNMLFVNQGLGDSGEPVFKEMAAEYKIDYDGHSVMAAFLDYDRDGDLDLYILVNQKLDNVPTNYRPKITDGSAANNDKLFRNEGDGTFIDVTIDAGIVYEGFGLGLAVTDVNDDGWPDIYVSNDYLSNDILYINNSDGTFRNGTTEWIGHQSQFSMGNDAVDINNDALPDIITLDMLPEINARKKTTIGNKNYLTYINNEKFDYDYQYVRNMVHLNNGLDNGIKFSEVGQLSGIYQTEWSWSPLFADFDNDGNKDAMITNGFPKDITDKDFANFRADIGNLASNRYLIDSIPVIKIPNYAYRNNGDLTFTDMTTKWGMNKPSFSNGAAFADLDNDGDLDYVVNNIDDNAFVYENTLYNPGQKESGNQNNYLRVALKGSEQNRQALGAKVNIYYDSGKVQFQNQSIYRGFLSSVEEISHFGVGRTSQIDSVVVQWPDGSYSMSQNVAVNQLIKIEYKTGQPKRGQRKNTNELLFKEASSELKISFLHQEDDKVDYNMQRTLPHKFTQGGPGLAVGDINADGLEDFIVGGSTNYNTAVFRQSADGTFSSTSKTIKDEGKIWEDEGILLFDADNDKDLDLYIVSGSIESQESSVYQDRLYLNDGKGGFSLATDALPIISGSGSCVRATDYDQDGDLDLFVGGRVVPAAYPMPAESYILRNDNGKFSDVTAEVCPALKNLGLVTDALWTDFNGDGISDIVVVGEFMAVSFFANMDGKFQRNASTGIDNITGWWNSIVGEDFDKDGDVDYVVGNLGLNNNYQVKREFPIKVFAKDFDGNGSIDPVLACYMRESMDSDVKKLYPVHFWEELNSQSPKFRQKYLKFKHYSMITIDQLFTPDELEGAMILETNEMASSYIENLGNGTFKMSALPMPAQVAPINGMVVSDVNNDGNADLIITGNDFGNEVFAGRYDALTGLILLGDGKGNFSAVPSSSSGFYVPGDAKAFVRLAQKKNDIFIASQNRDNLKVFSRSMIDDVKSFVPEPLDIKAELIFEDGRKQVHEFYYGSGYLSQSSRSIRLPKGVKEITVYNSLGESRKVSLTETM